MHKRDIATLDVKAPGVLPLLFCVAAFLALSVAWFVGIEGVRRAVKWIRTRFRRKGVNTKEGFNALHSTIPEQDEVHREVQERATLPASAQGRAREDRQAQESDHHAASLHLAASAPAITVTETDGGADDSFHELSNNPINTSTPTPDISVAEASEISMTLNSPLPPSQPESPLPSSACATVGSAFQSGRESLHNFPEALPGTLTPRVSLRLESARTSLRLEPIRTSLTPSPSPRHSLDIGSNMSDRSPSLAEFPIPPPRSPTPFSTRRSLSQSISRDLGDSRNLWSPTVSPENGDHHHNNVIIEEDPVSPDSGHEGTEYDPPNTASTRPPTYHGSWHRTTPSTASFSTLPLYPGDDDLDDDRASEYSSSRPPTYRSSTSTFRGPRIPRALPPPPVPPLPSA